MKLLCFILQVTLYHILKLFQSGPDVMQGKKTLVSEFYEEIVFQDPTVLMQRALTTTRQISHGPWKHETDCKFKQLINRNSILLLYGCYHYLHHLQLMKAAVPAESYVIHLSSASLFSCDVYGQ